VEASRYVVEGIEEDVRDEHITLGAHDTPQLAMQRLITRART
jgi:hypothetical protein